ncbi:MAG: 1-deoxy-D-xylulose-5-phosphate synthase, partial [Sedimentisphaerales bacterium]|nr:1-deoxy-D-xylulose-5-phosphate synthase [Sedimentisphaerales bacterium]
IKKGIRMALPASQMFESLNIPYFGPVDGHDIESLVQLFRAMGQLNHPVILHVYTKKGKGFSPAGTDPSKFHSTGPFILNGDEVESETEAQGRSFTNVFGEHLVKLAEKDSRIVAITSAMSGGTGLVEFHKRFGDRFFDVGIAESAAVDIAAGLAKSGLKPVVCIYSTFLQRSFDQIFQEVALQNLPVVLCMDRAGLVGGDGATHHGFCDITTTRCLPNMILMAPMDANELTDALKFAVQSDLPCAIRYPRDQAEEVEQMAVDYHSPPFELGRAVWVRNGRDAVVLAYGNAAYEALMAAETLAEEGIDLGVISARFAKPLDEKILHKLLADGHNMPIITMEENALIGGFGSAVLEFAQQHRLDARKITCIGLPDRLIDQDTRQRQLEQVGLTRQNLIKQVRRLLNKNKDNDESNEKKTDCPVSKPRQTPDHPGRTGTARMA